DLPGQPDGAAMEPTAQHQTGAHAAGELDVEEVGDAAAGAVLVLGHRAEVGVVVDGDRESQATAQLVGRGELVPARQDRLVDPGRPSVDGTRHAEPDHEQVVAADLRRLSGPT